MKRRLIIHQHGKIIFDQEIDYCNYFMRDGWTQIEITAENFATIIRGTDIVMVETTLKEES